MHISKNKKNKKFKSFFRIKKKYKGDHDSFLYFI